MDTIFLIISAGSGPEECAHAAALTLELLQREAEKLKNITVKVIETEASRVNGNIRSALVALEGEMVKSFADSWVGVIQWIWQSEYRPHHKRKNWFVSVRPFTETAQCELFSPSDVRFETARAGGPGGQHVNKTETSGRAIHIPTGRSVVAREERSQVLNKKLAVLRLAAMFQREREEKELEAKSELRHSHWELERGNPIRVYDGESMKLIKNNSTGKGANRYV